MARGLYKAFNIESGEETIVFLLILQSIFLGTFYGTFDISAHALFLDIFGAEMIPKAYIVSGLVGIIMTTVYSRLQARMGFSSFARLNLIAVAVITILMRLGYILTDKQWHTFLVFVMMGPLNIVALLGFWGTVGRIFTLRQGKRLFGLIDTGQIVGIIIASYAVPLLLSFQFATKDLLFISSISIFIAFFMQMIISGKVTFEQKKDEEETVVKEDFGFFSLFKNRYITLMALFVVFLVIVTFFVHYSFLAVTKEKYPEQVDLAAFLGYFTGTLMIFSLLVKTFVYGRLLKTYGLKLALVISPLLILFFTVIAAFIGGFFGYTAAAASFTFFFLIISVSKLFAKALQDSIVAPSLKILYQSLDARIRYNVQARVDGTINEISAVSSGVILFIIGSLAFLGLIHFTYVLIFILIGWAFVSLRLYKAYKKSLSDSLARFQQTETETGIMNTAGVIREGFTRGPEVNILNGLKISEIIDLNSFKEAVLQCLENASKLVRKFSISKIKEHGLKDTVTEIEKKSKLSAEDRKMLKSLVDYMNDKLSADISKEKLSRLVKSASRDDRIKVARFLQEKESFDHLPTLNTLLRDNDPDVKITAIQVTSHHKVPETIPVLIDLLSTRFYRYAFDALVQVGEKAPESLENAFYRTGISNQTLIRIIRIMERIQTPETDRYLINKINHHNHQIALQAIDSLKSRAYQADEQNIHKIIQAARTVIGILAWKLAAQYTIRENEMGPFLEKAINEEIASGFNQLFSLLSLAYDPKSIYHIRENLEAGTSESIGFAIELLDLFVADELKPVLFPVLEDTSPLEKIRQLQVEFPVDIMEPYDLVIALINRDPNYINPFTKACALLSLDDLQDIKISNDLIAQVFNSDQLLSQLAAWKIFRSERDLYGSIVERLGKERKELLNKQMELIGKNDLELIINKTFYLEKIEYFNHLSGAELIPLARLSEIQNLREKQLITLNPGPDEKIVAFVVTGNLTFLMNNKEISSLTASNIAGVMPYLFNESDKFDLRADSEAVILKMKEELFSELMFDQDKLALAVYHWMNDQSGKHKDIINESLNLVS
jgi:AAA family ATP:ADP antiporter